jgi:hypothetical protein
MQKFQAALSNLSPDDLQELREAHGLEASQTLRQKRRIVSDPEMRRSLGALLRPFVAPPGGSSPVLWPGSSASEAGRIDAVDVVPFCGCLEHFDAFLTRLLDQVWHTVKHMPVEHPLAAVVFMKEVNEEGNEIRSWARAVQGPP